MKHDLLVFEIIVTCHTAKYMHPEKLITSYIVHVYTKYKSLTYGTSPSPGPSLDGTGTGTKFRN